MDSNRNRNQEKHKDIYSPMFIKFVGNIAKFTTHNFHFWNQDFLSVIRLRKGANDIVLGKITPKDPSYDKQLDDDLVNAIMSSSKLDGDENIRHLIVRKDTKDYWTANTLYTTIKTELTKNDQHVLTNIYDRLARLEMIGFDIKTVIHELNVQFTRARVMGVELDFRIVTLKRCVKVNNVYSDTLDLADMIGHGNDFTLLSEALIQKQEDLERHRAQRRP